MNENKREEAAEDRGSEKHEGELANDELDGVSGGVIPTGGRPGSGGGVNVPIATPGGPIPIPYPNTKL